MPVQHQAITQSHPDLLSIAHLGIIFSEIQIEKLFIHENAFEYVFYEIAAILSRRRWVKSFSWSTYLPMWLHVYMATTRCQSGMAGGAWNSIDTTEQTPLWYVITLGTPDTHTRPIAMVADALMWNKHQAIINNHADLIMVIVCVTSIMLHS